MSKKEYKSVYLDSGVEILNNYELLNFLQNTKRILKNDLLIAYSLAVRRNSVWACSFPSMKTLMGNSGLSKSGILNSLKSLAKNDIIIIINTGKTIEDGKYKYDGRTGNTYFFIYDIDYQHGIIEREDEHPLHKSDHFMNLFELAYMDYKNKD